MKTGEEKEFPEPGAVAPDFRLATRVMNLLLQVLLFPRGTRDQGAAPARGWNGKCSSVLQDTLDIQRQET